jgi:hypothetical protein
VLKTKIGDNMWIGLKYHGEDHSGLFMISDNGELLRINSNKILKQRKNKQGYMCVCVSLGSKTNLKNIKIHRAVMESFSIIDESRPHINHIDFNKTNNSITNLEWCTAKENYAHSRERTIERTPRGEGFSRSKLKNEDIIFIRNNYIPYNKEYGARPLSRHFGVLHEEIRKIVKREVWKHI